MARKRKSTAEELLESSPRVSVPLPNPERYAKASAAERIAFDLFQQGKSIEEIAKTQILPEAQLERFLAESFEDRFDLIKGPLAAQMVTRLKQIALSDAPGNVDSAKFLASAASNKLDPQIRREQVRAQLDLEGNILLKKLSEDVDIIPALGHEVVIKALPTTKTKENNDDTDESGE